MNFKNSLIFLVFVTFLTAPFITRAQITAPGASASETTSYPVFTENDNLYIFCSQGPDQNVASLTAQSNLSGSKTYLWEKYNNQSGQFEFFSSETTDAMESTISNLPSGAYRVSITQDGNTQVFRAWVFNSWLTASGSVTESTCTSFRLQGEFATADLTYYDLSSNAPVEVVRDVNVQWYQGETVVSSVINPQIFNPPAVNTDYTLRVSDRFGCEASANVNYQSIVTIADFTAEPTSGEAPLTVTFTNNSINGSSGEYEWFFYHDLDYIKQQQPADSINFIAYDESPVYTFENSGTYNVKLVAKNIGANQTCTDTAYLADFIRVDTSFIAAGNVFTPNGDGTNDVFLVKYWSMESIKISIFNRWGKRVHVWESSNVRGFEETVEESVWDGRIGNRWASPGVYYYVAVGKGRDGHERRERGFVHLFRDKD